MEPGITVMTPLNFLHYPYSHSLVALVVWGVLFAVVYSLMRRTGLKTAVAVALLVVYAANLLGPPPPSADAVAWSAQALWLIVIWGFWVDRHRVGRG